MTVDELAEILRTAREGVVSTLTALFWGMSSYREADAEAFARQALPLILAGQRTVAQVVAAYTQQAAQDAAPAGIVIPPISIPDADVLGRLPDIDLYPVYQRPIVTIWAELAKAPPARVLDAELDAAPDPVDVEGSMTKAVDKGAKRLASMVDMDLQQAQSRAARAAMQALGDRRGPLHWRRVLVGEENCALCTIASTQKYSLDVLKPVHPGCDCQVRPVFPGQDDPDDDNLLESAHAAVEELTGVSDRGGRAPDYRKIILSMTKEHSELPVPLLARPQDRFATAKDIPNAAKARVRTNYPGPAWKPSDARSTRHAQVVAQIAALERSLPTVKSDRARTYQTEQLGRLRAELDAM